MHIRELLKLPDDIRQMVEALVIRIRSEADPQEALDLVVAGLEARFHEPPKP